MFLSDASLRRPVAMTTLLIGLLVIGAFSYMRLGLDFLPKIDFPYVTVATVYPGAGPREVETLISETIEDAVSEVDGVKHVRSTSMENMSQVFIEFEMGTDVDFAAIDVREKVDLIKSELPDDAEAPVILKFDANAKPVMNLALLGDRAPNELYDLADDVIKDQLTRVPGLASVELVGGQRREVQVLVNQERLAGLRMSIMQVAQAIAAENLDLPSGHITENTIEYTVRVEGEFDSVDAIRALDIPTPLGKTVPLTDVAEVVDGFEERRELARYNGRECVGLVLKKRGDANTVEVVERVREELARVNESLPGGVTLEVVNDDSHFIKNSVDDVITSMLLGVLLTAVILYLFLHDLRQTFIAALAMPASIIATFTLVYFAGFTLNVMSLMALGISVGILVTNAIVVLENIHRHMSLGDNARHAAAAGTSEIALAVLSSTLTNVVVFLPIAFMSGIIGELFNQFGLTITFATMVSLFISFTLTPILSWLLLGKRPRHVPRRGPLQHFFNAWDRAYDRLAVVYGKAINLALDNRSLTIVFAIAAFIATLGIAGHIGSEMITEPDRGEVTVSVEMPPGTPLTKTNAVFEQLEQVTQRDFADIVTGTYVKVGKTQGLFGKSSQGVHVGEMLLTLVPKEQRPEDFHAMMQRMRAAYDGIAGAMVTVRQPTALGGAEAPMQLELHGQDLDTLAALSSELLDATKSTQGTADVDTTWRSGKPELSITPKRQKLEDYGLSIAQVAAVLRANIEGFVPTEYRVGSNEYDIRVKLAEPDRQNIDQVRDFMVPLHDGSTIPLHLVADVKLIEGPTQIIRKDKQRLVVISANMTDRPLGAVVTDLQTRIDAMNLAPGYGTYFAGEVEYMEESFADLFMALVLAIVLTYLVLAALLESFLQPFTIMLTLPLAMIGVFLALFITGKTISIFTLMAVVMLVGIVVNNAILLIDYTTVLRQQGKTRREALLEACPVKLRPIIMTTLATIVGMLPIALGFGWGAEMRAPMAIVTIGGLIVSSVLALFVIPVVYAMFDDLGAFILRRRAQPASAPDSEPAAVPK